MENVLHRLARLFFPADEEETVPLMSEEEELKVLGRRIEAAQSRFDAASEEGEIDAAVYDLNALETRYRLLVRRIKEKEKAAAEESNRETEKDAAPT